MVKTPAVLSAYEALAKTFFPEESGWYDLDMYSGVEIPDGTIFPELKFEASPTDWVPAKASMAKQAISPLATPNGAFMENLWKLGCSDQLEDQFNIRPEVGSWVRISNKDDKPWNRYVDDQGNTYIMVYLSTLEAGLRFPVHPFVHDIQCYYSICLTQVTPQSIRAILGFI